MYIGLVHTHNLIITLFLLIYLIKTVLLLANKKELLKKFSSKFKIPEIIISVLFLTTGVMMLLMKEYISSIQVIKLILVFSAIPVAVIGFKKSNKILAIASLLMIVVTYGLGEISAKRVQKIAINSDIITDTQNPAYSKSIHGAALFETNCAYCHGKDYRSINGAADLNNTKTDDKALYQIISDGKKRMPSYKKIMNETEIEALIEHIQTLKK